jgi:flagellar hook-associated protein 1 FlgK
MSALSIGVSALDVTQRLLDLTGQNVANAGTPGYHRQVADLVMTTAGGAVGTGVDIAQVRRLIDDGLERAILGNTSDTQNVSTQLNTLQQVQAQLQPSDGSVNTLLSNLFNQMTQLAGSPDDMTQRQTVLSTATALTNELNSLSAGLQQTQAGLDSQATQLVAQANGLLPKIAQLNAAIQNAVATGNDANDLSDQRDQCISQLAQIADVRTVPGNLGQVNVLIGGTLVVAGDQAVSLQYNTDSAGNAFVAAGGSSSALPLSGGQLAGLLAQRNTNLPGLRGQLDTLAQALVRGLDGIQATGLGLGGPLTVLGGQRAVTSVTAPLAQAGLAFPPQAGDLYVSVTNQATGTRTLTKVTINPATESLQDVANALSAVPNLQAVVDPQTKTLTLLAQPGYAFDFAGRLASAPQTTALTGTATAQVAGSYTGTANDVFTYTVVGSGTVGVTPGLSLEVRNSAGTLLNTLNIGQGYQPGSALPAVEGVTASLSAGTVNAGDNFSTTVVAQPDTAGILTALGLNTFFAGGSAADLRVNPDLTANPAALAASQTGQPGDGSNMQKMAAVQDSPLLSGGTQTPGQYYAGLVAAVGAQVQALTDQQTAQNQLAQSLSAQQQSISGVDSNEELVNMLQYQRSFQVAARYISVINDTLTSLTQMI